MQKNESRLTVLFEDPFWVAVYERIADGKLEVCKVTFGTEPKDGEVYAFFLGHFSELMFSPAVTADEIPEKRINPKRQRRQISRQLENRGIGTKSQQALKMQQEAGKVARKESAKQRKETELALKFELHQQKQKEKHKGH